MGITIVNQSNAEMTYQIYGGGSGVPSGSGAWPSGSGAWPSGSGAWPSGSGAWPSGSGAWPSGSGAWPSGSGAWPSGYGLASGMIPSGGGASGILVSGYRSYTVVINRPELPRYTVSGSGIVTVYGSNE